MIRAVTLTTARTAGTVSAEILFIDEGTAGIHKIVIVDMGGVEIVVPQPQDCPQRYVVTLPEIERTRLPLRAEAVDCTGRSTPQDEIGSLLLEHAVAPPPPRPSCMADACNDSAACTRAHVLAGEALTGLAPRCRECAELRDGERRNREMFWAYFILALALLVVAAAVTAQGFWGWIGGLFFAAGAFVLFGQATEASGRARGFAAQAEDCEERLAEERAAFQEAIQEATASCCEHCITIPLGAPC